MYRPVAPHEAAPDRFAGCAQSLRGRRRPHAYGIGGRCRRGGGSTRCRRRAPGPAQDRHRAPGRRAARGLSDARAASPAIQGNRRHHGRSREHREKPHAVRAREAARPARGLPGAGEGGAMSRVDCHKLDQSFMDYLYEELAAGEMGELRAHLEACARCSDEDNRFRSLRRKVAHLRIVEPPEAVSAQLMREARSVRSGSGSGSPWRKAAYYATPLVAMAAALAIWAHARVRYDGWAIDGSPSTPEYRAPAQVPLDDA